MLLAPSSSAPKEEWKEIARVEHSHAILTLGLARTNPTAFYTGTAANVTRILKCDYSRSVLLAEIGMPVKAILVHDDGRVAIARERDLEMWKDDIRVHLIEFEDTISCAAWEGNTLVVAIHMNVFVYDASTMMQMYCINLSDNILSLSVSPISGLVLAQSSSQIYLWRPGQDEIEKRRTMGSSSLSCASVGNLKAFFGCSDGTCFTLDLSLPIKHQSIKNLFGHTNNVRSVQVSKDDTKALSASWDCSLRVWCLRTGETLRVLNNVHNSYVTVGRFLGRDNSYVVSGSSDKLMKVFDLHYADRERLTALVSGRKEANVLSQFPLEVMRLIKTMLFNICLVGEEM